MSDFDPAWLDASHEERRAVETTLALWREAAGLADVPRLADIKIQYDGDGWEHRFLLIEDPNPVCSVFILCGAAVRAAFDGAVVGRSLEEVVPAGGQSLTAACAKAVRDRVPVKVAGAFSPQAGVRQIYRAIFLPVRGDAGSPGYILGTIGLRRELVGIGLDRQ